MRALLLFTVNVILHHDVANGVVPIALTASPVAPLTVNGSATPVRRPANGFQTNKYNPGVFGGNLTMKRMFATKPSTGPGTKRMPTVNTLPSFGAAYGGDAHKRGGGAVNPIQQTFGNLFSWMGLRSSNERDQVLDTDDAHYNIYKRVATLLVSGMTGWLERDSNDLTGVERYLGYDSKTASAIDVAMTQLLDQQLKKKMTVGNLFEMYYYSCDLQNSADDVNKVKEKFRSMINECSWIVEKVGGHNVKKLVSEIYVFMDQVPVRVKSQFSVTIPLMKNSMFTDPSVKKQFKSLWEFVDSDSGKTLHEIAESYSASVNEHEVRLNHMEVIYCVLPKMFRYLLDNMHILLHLSAYQLDDDEKKYVQRFSTFADKLNKLFVRRYFTFRGEYDENLFMVLDNFVKFYETSTGEDTTALNLLNNRGKYYEKADKRLKFALQKFMQSFNYNNSFETSTINFKGTESKDVVFGMIKKNIDESLKIVEEYSKYFIPDEVVRQKTDFFL